MVLFSFFVSELREHFAKSRLVLLPAMTDSCARGVLNDQAIVTAATENVKTIFEQIDFDNSL